MDILKANVALFAIADHLEVKFMVTEPLRETSRKMDLYNKNKETNRTNFVLVKLWQ